MLAREEGRSRAGIPVVQRVKRNDREGNLFQRHMAVTTDRSGETLSEGVVVKSEWAGCLTFAIRPPAPSSKMEYEVDFFKYTVLFFLTILKAECRECVLPVHPVTSLASLESWPWVGGRAAAVCFGR